MAVGLYIHVPFCRARCHFCAFYLRLFRENDAQDYVHVLCREIWLHAEADTLNGRQLETIYLGGGTPTTLSPEQLRHIVEQVRADLGVHPHAEVSIEAHPGSVTMEGLSTLVQGGFNRISFGVQSLDESELIAVGRPTDAMVPHQAVTSAREAGFRNIGLDLIYGLPGQTLKGWLSTLDAAISLQPTHLSCYALTVEERTKLERDTRLGNTSIADPDLQITMEEATVRRLDRAGFEHYEVSNYCRSGFASRHNLLYWQGEEYLGLGPSAQSYVGGCRFGNGETLGEYVRMLQDGKLPITGRERLSDRQQQRDAVVFGLRLIQGIDRGLVQNLEDRTWQHSLHRLLREGYLEERAGLVRMSAWGRRYADTIAMELL